MKKITQKSILQKIIITIIVALLLSNFIVPTYSHADIGGVLMDPITDLLCSVGDVVINLLQKCMTGDWGSDGFSLFKGGFLVDSETFFTSADYAEYRTTETGEEIDPNDPDSGFNKTLLTGKTQDYYIPIATYSPEQIFTGNVAGLDINFIDPKEYKDKAGNDVESSAAQLQPTIAKWYVALRNLTVVGLLSVLVYVGIRIIISSTATDKAKYKQMLMDWLIALCIVFFLHYVMSFTLTLTQSICDAISGGGDETVVITVTGQSESFKTNLLGAARFKTQYDDLGQKVAYLIMYLALVIYTLIFTWFYLKRLLMMAFLTVVAPVVALTYPIDKMNDGKAQAFDSWLKEYIFNALIQPFHLIIYTVFVSSAMDLASTNIIYMIAALAFIMPAEKILRKFFGFEKAGAGTLGALAGGAALGSMAKKLIGGGRKSGKSSSGGNSQPEGEKPLRFESKHDVSQIEGAGGNDDSDNAEEQSALDKYTAEGFGQNANGEYYNPWTDEYDANYDPNKDPAYARQNNNTQTSQGKPQEEQENENKKNNPFLNWTRAHNINGRSALKLGGRAIKGAVKFGTRTAFKAGAGTLAGAVALASGAGLAGAGAAFMAGSSVGGRLGDGAIKAGGFVASGVSRFGKGIAADWKAKDGEHGDAFVDAMLGGTRLGREIDLANGNTRFQDAGQAREIKENKDNVQYVREYIAAQNGGAMPSAKEVRDKMNSFDPYIAEGLTDIKDMLKAQKAEGYVSSQKQAAIIAAIGKERGITADILNDDKKAKAQEANLRQDFINKGYSQATATKQANYTMNVLKVQNGVAHNLQKQPKTKK